jgi:A/G-specific adenine glycosylase
MQMEKRFTENLMRWHAEENDRQMPWKGETDAYKIWLSEIILQQTRVAQGLAYYERFIQTFPTVFDLAKAKPDKVMKLWEGLGYYSRCRNLHFTAKEIVQKYKGVFPNTYAEILTLKGIGPYTAAAIASFAFLLPHAVLDGNVFRVLSRYWGVDTAIDGKEGKTFFAAKANQVLDQKRPDLFNQAIMDFGATVCKPVNPDCTICPLQKHCVACKREIVDLLPVKEKKLKISTRYFTYLVLTDGKNYLLKQRKGKDIWQGLYEPFLLETKSKKSLQKDKIKIALAEELGEMNFELLKIGAWQKQLLTHQILHFRFCEVRAEHLKKTKNYVLASTKELKKFAFPKMVKEYFDSEHK